jgi:hypothetical protein
MQPKTANDIKQCDELLQFQKWKIKIKAYEQQAAISQTFRYNLIFFFKGKSFFCRAMVSELPCFFPLLKLLLLFRKSPNDNNRDNSYFFSNLLQLSKTKIKTKSATQVNVFCQVSFFGINIFLKITSNNIYYFLFYIKIISLFYIKIISFFLQPKTLHWFSQIFFLPLCGYIF